MNILKSTKNAVFLALLILSSCASHPNKVACPSFGSSNSIKNKKVKNRLIHLNFRDICSSKKKQKSKDKGTLNALGRDGQFAVSEEIHLKSLASIEGDNSLLSVTEPIYHALELYHYKEHTINVRSNTNVQKLKTVTKSTMKTQHQETRRAGIFSKKISDDEIPKKSGRKTAWIIGGSLLLMAVLSGISIPVLGTLTASIGLIGIFLLDIVVSFGIYKYHKKEKPKLAKASSILRLLYTAILGVGIGYHIAGNLGMFNMLWGIGLIAFGIHLITLGIVFHNEGGKKWVNILIKSLLILAGIGYIIQYVGILVVPNPVGFAVLIESIFIVPMILGEVFYALWMLIKGGKSI